MCTARSLLTARLLMALTILGCLLDVSLVRSQQWKPDIPRTWDDTALADWATPVAGLNVRPTHMTAREYYALPTENLRTYPVYLPDREPRGYWQMLQRVGPKPLVEPSSLKTEDNWITVIAAARNKDTLDAEGGTLPDGSVFGLRWVPTSRGVALSFSNCSNCHLRYLPDGSAVAGIPVIGSPRLPLKVFGGTVRQPATAGAPRIEPLVGQVQQANRVVVGATPFVMGSEPFGMWLYRAFGVPWKSGDVNERLKTMTMDEYGALNGAFRRGGGLPRWNGSLYYPAKVPDLIGVKDRKYIDHTATHLHRNIGDLMRYGALVSYADAADFAPHHFLGEGATRVTARAPDEALYALALYIYSLKPPPNPNPLDEKAAAGQKVFAREGCPRCHTPPLYTSNKLTLAQGFEPPTDAPSTLDVLRVSVRTDPELALATRKGTGYYKVPSLKGVWYRGHYLHDGAAASLEEMFDPLRLEESHVRGGWSPPGTTTAPSEVTNSGCASILSNASNSLHSCDRYSATGTTTCRRVFGASWV
jgi:hypothetical protein